MISHFRQIAFAAVVVGLPALAPAQSRFVATKELTIGADRADLSTVQAVAISTHGTIAVGQPQDRAVRLFDPRGKLLGVVGKNGEGPGEFRTVIRLGWRGDTLWVYDRVLNRLTFFGPDHKLLRTLALPRAVQAPVASKDDRPSYGSLYVINQLSATSLFGSLLSEGAPEVPRWLSGITPRSISLVETTLDGHLLRVILTRPSTGQGDCLKEATETSGRKFTTSFGVPFCKIPTEGYAENGPVVHLSPGKIAPGRGSFTMKIFDVKGKTLSQREYDYVPVSIPRRVVDSARKHLAASTTQPVLKAAYLALEFPKYFPPVGAIVVGADGTVWLGDGNIASLLCRWRVFDQQGIELGFVELPWSVSVQGVRRDLAWGVESDSDGVQDVVRFKITGK